MRVTFNWLKEYVNFNLSPEELAQRLDLTGTEVESLTFIGDGLDNVVVGKIETINPHPNADRLTYCRVAVGGKKSTNIVCGAKNIKVGDRVPVALPGAELPSGIKISTSKIRGVISEGMMCSATELQLGKDASGILILPASAKIGAPISHVLELEDRLMEMEITPNRPDCLGIIGLAREVAAITGGKFKTPTVKVPENSNHIKDQVEVEVHDADLCPRYVARLLKDVKIHPSPLWLARRLEAVGIRPINNIVDITNYVMMETGQPLHAFDLNLLKGNKIIVRRAKPKEVLVTIDHVKRVLNSDMLVIADTKHPVALAGVMGGFDSEISEQTTDVLLESANFLATNIMRTSRSLGLISESSYRFEKGIDINGCLYAADRAAQMMADIAGAVVQKGAVDNYPKTRKTHRIVLRPGRVNQILGTNLAPKRMVNILTGLGLTVKPVKARILAVTVPTFRIDLEREIDLIEEVARLHGLNNIPGTLPSSTAETRDLTFEQKQRQNIRNLLLAAGLNEVVTYSFIGGKDLDRLLLPKEHPLRKVIELANPISEEQELLRPSLIPGLLLSVQYNQNRGQNNIHLFEIGGVFLTGKKDAPAEILELGGVLSGAWQSPQWYKPAREIDFYDLKGLIEALAVKLRLSDVNFAPVAHPCFHPGAAAELLSDGEPMGIFGQIHPEVQSAFDIKAKIFSFQFNASKLINHIRTAIIAADIPRYPGVELDLALVVDERVTNAGLESLIWNNGDGLLKELRLFDLYRGGNLPRGRKSMAYALTYRSDKRTLTDLEVAKIHQRIMQKAKQELGATLRD